jgi:hypothetical protein
MASFIIVHLNRRSAYSGSHIGQSEQVAIASFEEFRKAHVVHGFVTALSFANSQRSEDSVSVRMHSALGSAKISVVLSVALPVSRGL